MQNFMGMDGFIWFTGVVEDRNDPSKLGRVRVRCVGHHTDDKSKIPTADLPWAHIMHPVTDPSMNGLGNTPSFMVEGTWVVGFFMDAEDKQQPVIIGTLPGVPDEKPNTSKGFYDPNGVYPKTDFLEESDTNRLARNEKISSTVVTDKSVDRSLGVPAADGSFFDEPKTTYDAKYPKNHVFETESGHIVEYDDTDGKTRLHEYHKSGTFREIDEEGNRHERIVKDNYEFVRGNEYRNIFKDVFFTSGGTLNIKCKNLNIEVEENYTQQIGENVIINVGGTLESDITGAVTEVYGSTITRSVTGITTNNHDANVNNFIDGDFEVHTSAAVDIFAKTTVNIDTASFDVDASTVAAITSATTTINGSTASNIRGATVSVDGTTVNIDTGNYNLKATTSNLITVTAGAVVPHATDPDVTSPGSASVTDPTNPTISEPIEPVITDASPSHGSPGGATDTPKDANGDNIMPEGGELSAGSVIDAQEIEGTFDEDTEVSQGTVTSTNSTNKTKTVKGVTKKDMYKSKNPVSRDNVGDLVKKYESANGGPGTISEPSGADYGGHSYGSYQITNKNMDDYIEYLESTGTNKNRVLAQKLRDAGGSSGARNPDKEVTLPNGKKTTFREVWKQAAVDDSTNFQNSQAGYISTSNFRPAVEKIKNQIGLDVSDRGASLQDAVWSTSTQYGATGGSNLIKNALKGQDISKLTDGDIINLIHDEKRRGVLESTVGSGQWGSSVNKTEIIGGVETNVWLPYTTAKGNQAIGLRQALLNRIEEERLDLLRSA